MEKVSKMKIRFANLVIWMNKLLRKKVGKMRIQLVNPNYSDERIRVSILRMLESTELCSMATIGPDDEAHISTAYFCYDEELYFYFLSDPATRHCQDVAIRPTMAMAIFRTTQQWGSVLSGLQLFGTSELAKGQEVDRSKRAYEMRYPAFSKYWSSLDQEARQKFPSRFYIFRPAWIKILEENEFGEETFVDAQVIRNSKK